MVHIEIRKSILSSRARGNTIGEIARIYGVTERTVYNLLSLYRETGNINQRGGKKGRKPVLSEKDLAQMDKVIEKKPNITINEIRHELDILLSESQVSRIVRDKLGYRLKKKTMYAAERK